MPSLHTFPYPSRLLCVIKENQWTSSAPHEIHIFEEGLSFEACNAHKNDLLINLITVALCQLTLT